MSAADVATFWACMFLIGSLIVALGILGGLLHRSVTRPAPGVDEALAWRPGVES